MEATAISKMLDPHLEGPMLPGMKSLPLHCITSILGLSLFLLRWPVEATADTSRPNLVVILADDIGVECFGSYGSSHYATPRLDKMAEEGMRFTRAHAQPLCTPTRVQLMTGLSNVRNYAAFSVLRRDQRTFAQDLQAAGYRTFVAGKWQLYGAEHYSEAFRGKGTLPESAGFDEHCLWQVDQLGSRFWQPLLRINGKNKQFEGPDDYGPELVTDHILDFMERHAKEPFLVYYPMILVHNPFEPTPDSADRKQQNKQKNFDDMVSFMDLNVGRILDKLRELGIHENTLVLFMGDNGTNKAITSPWKDGGSYKGGKGSTTRFGTHVPMFAWGPTRVPSGQTCDRLVDTTDFLPTLLEAAGISLSRPTDGVSFLPSITGGTPNTKTHIFSYYFPRPEKGEPTTFVMNADYKLYADGRFYNLRRDPDERQALNPPTGKKAISAREQMQVWLEAMPREGQSLLKFGHETP